MATYTELYGLWQDSTMRNKVSTACIVAAETITNELDTVPNHANRLIWAKQAFDATAKVAEGMWKAVLAANKDASVATIQGASDALIQTNVDDHVDLFADGS